MRRPEPATARQTKPTPAVALVPGDLTPEAEIAKLTEIRASLAVQLPPLDKAKADAILHRRNILLSGTADEVATVEANRVCRERESDWFAIHDAVLEADRRLADATERRDAEAMEAERQRVAGALERNAGEIQTASTALTKAISEVSRAHALLTLTISRQSAGQFDPQNGIASPSGVADAILLQGLAKGIPGIEIVGTLKPWSLYALQERVAGADAEAIVSEFASRLRDAAGKVREQQIHHVLPVTEEPGPVFRANTEEESVYVTKPFSYHRSKTDRTMVPVGKFGLPVRVAELAIDAGCASEDEPPGWGRLSGRDHAEGRGPKFVGTRASRIEFKECHDLGFNLAEWQQAELADRRAKWLGRQTQAAA